MIISNDPKPYLIPNLNSVTFIGNGVTTLYTVPAGKFLQLQNISISPSHTVTGNQILMLLRNGVTIPLLSHVGGGVVNPNLHNTGGSPSGGAVAPASDVELTWAQYSSGGYILITFRTPFQLQEGDTIQWSSSSVANQNRLVEIAVTGWTTT